VTARRAPAAVVSTLADLREARRNLAPPFGLVPTMGALHAGHAALVRRARAECASVGGSIFVNPAQFGPAEDLSKYPRTLERDLELLAGCGADLVYTPRAEDVYPEGFQTFVNVERLSLPLEGASRPGHFRGVATVVLKLLLAFGPDRAYFGQKDAQQVAVIRRMVRDLEVPVEVVVVPTVREGDGLALSSRNAYLMPAERTAAPVLFRALAVAVETFERGERSADRLRAAMRGVLSREPLAETVYVSAADPETLGELDEVTGDLLLSMAVRVGSTRLIDNVLFERGRWETGVREVR
jgi:pantoate--beta-alanine ligase